jgi:hypothetical protein
MEPPYLCRGKWEEISSPEAAKKENKKINKTRLNKTMKKIILTFAIIFTAVAVTFAQVTPTATVNLNVKLNAIQSIVASASTVDLVYTTVEDYNLGVKSEQANHLTVYSTGGFIVKVASSVKDLNASSGSQTIESSGISVTASNGTTTLSPSYKKVNLGTTSSELINSSIGGTEEKFNVEYQAAGGNAYVNKFFKGTGASTDATVYTTVVTYSIEAK